MPCRFGDVSEALSLSAMPVNTQNDLNLCQQQYENPDIKQWRKTSHSA